MFRYSTTTLKLRSDVKVDARVSIQTVRQYENSIYSIDRFLFVWRSDVETRSVQFWIPVSDDELDQFLCHVTTVHPAGKLNCDASLVVFHSPLDPSNSSLACTTKRAVQRRAWDLYRYASIVIGVIERWSAVIRLVDVALSSTSFGSYRPLSARKLFSYQAQRCCRAIAQFACLATQNLIAVVVRGTRASGSAEKMVEYTDSSAFIRHLSWSIWQSYRHDRLLDHYHRVDTYWSKSYNTLGRLLQIQNSNSNLFAINI